MAVHPNERVESKRPPLIALRPLPESRTLRFSTPACRSPLVACNDRPSAFGLLLFVEGAMHANGVHREGGGQCNHRQLKASENFNRSHTEYRVRFAPTFSRLVGSPRVILLPLFSIVCKMTRLSLTHSRLCTQSLTYSRVRLSRVPASFARLVRSPRVCSPRLLALSAYPPTRPHSLTHACACLKNGVRK